MILSPQHITPSDLREVEAFFEKQVGGIVSKNFLSNEHAKVYISWHSFRELLTKIIDPQRFLRITRNEQEKIIGFFEAKPHSQELNTQVVQWTLIDKNYRRSGIGSAFANEFQEYCQSKGVKKIITYIHKNNKASLSFREKLGFIRVEEDEKSGVIMLEKNL